MANILIDLGHPAHVHLFRNAARDWQVQGHQVLFSALDREMILHLLQIYNLPYRVTYKRRPGKLNLMVELALRTLSTYKIARQFKADLFVSFGNPTVGLPARLMGKPYLALTDTDHATEQHALFKPFATVIATPTTFKPDLGPSQKRYPGFHELAYLHPDEFTPDPGELTPLGLTPGECFFVVRFVAWGATHDVGQKGLTLAEKRELLCELSAFGRVLLSVEGDVDQEFAPLVTQFAPEKIHHLLAFATMYIGEGGTMASEAAVLGTPALFVNTLTAGNWFDLRDNYELLYFYSSGREALEKARQLLNTPDLKGVWMERRARMLADKINPMPWLVDLGNQLLARNSG
jgi:predicted glycosyltransferase